MRIFDQGIDSLECFLVLALAVVVVFPGCQGPSDPCWLFMGRHQPGPEAEPDPCGTALWSEQGGPRSRVT